MDQICAPLGVQRESGDGEDSILSKKSLTATGSLPLEAKPKTAKEICSSKKLERITTKIQNTWLRHHLRHPTGAGRLILDVSEWRTQVILPAKLPGKRVVQLIPRVLERESAATKNKEPRFIPYEPYKAAVQPMRPPRKPAAPRKNNLDLNILVAQMSTVKSAELTRPATESLREDALSVQREHYEHQLNEIRKEKNLIENQLKFQAQVNGELKNLLVSAVSSVGDDGFVSDKITSMAEDKLHLAKRLLNTAEDLSNRTEMIEYYAGQIEVWRSKFLASSVMVEELARWKTSLGQRNVALLRSNKKMMENTARLREIQVELLTNLAFLDQNTLELPSSNALDLAKENLSISQRLVLQHNKVGMPEVLNLTGLETMTEAEKLAAKALETSNDSLISTDELLRAVMGQTYCRKDETTGITENKQ